MAAFATPPTRKLNMDRPLGKRANKRSTGECGGCPAPGAGAGRVSAEIRDWRLFRTWPPEGGTGRLRPPAAQMISRKWFPSNDFGQLQHSVWRRYNSGWSSRLYRLPFFPPQYSHQHPHERPRILARHGRVRTSSATVMIALFEGAWLDATRCACCSAPVGRKRRSGSWS